jgi:hypothetical protein
MRDLNQYQFVQRQDYEAVAGPDWPHYDHFQQHHNVDDSVYDEIDSMLLPPFDPPAFCVQPFYNWEYPKNTPCCMMKTKYDIDQVRDDMLSGRRTDACKACWKLEDAGIESDRQIKNSTLDFYYQIELKTLYDQAVNGNAKVVNYKIDSSNTCTAVCVTCNSHDSSAWGQLERQNGVTPAKTWKLDTEEHDRQIDYAAARTIMFRGGEPFLHKTNFYILEQLIAHNNQNCFISFVTNGSSILSDYQKELLDQFPNLSFSFSIDGIGPVFEYMRYPLKWDLLQENINYCRQKEIPIYASFTISNVNMLYYQQTKNWFTQNQIISNHNLVGSPEYFSPTALPLHIKQHIIDQGIDDDMKRLVLTNHTTQDDVNYQQFLKEIARQDQWKGIRMQDYLPELARLIDLK